MAYYVNNCLSCHVAYISTKGLRILSYPWVDQLDKLVPCYWLRWTLLSFFFRSVELRRTFGATPKIYIIPWNLVFVIK